ncbi:helix-turn-helix domain-containing protein [Bacteroides stercoris]|uniref:DNA-binding helix-turn-helix protein n=1 Tax=Bacteroides stercoris ATCC 43183 TaxID=449673 RepID=B0NMB9_BACSE|nr:helix-turn-helix transcriptional regulator [Bacteroides stercoris]EDS16428.1 DNA-binding helix-turn-helix protein [Bacteroides stercoris ATCC 43183]UWO02716.1 helix-turn-helix transcriptional regulator [Bacteroides stercoris ATCC 43183]SDX43720.1 Helix-turn-helix [Bacteroides stercoris]
MNRIKEILKEQGVTINELADKLGISRVTLSTQINGTANIVSYEKIATALNVPMWQLFASPKEIQPQSDGASITCPNCGKSIKIKVD